MDRASRAPSFEKSGIEPLRRKLQMLRAGVNVLFQEPRDGTRTMRSLTHAAVLETYGRLLACIDEELVELEACPQSARRYCQVVSERPDSLDYLNAMQRQTEARSLAELLKESIGEVLIERLPEGVSDEQAVANPQMAHAVHHAAQVASLGMAVPAEYMDLLKTLGESQCDGAVPRLEPMRLGTLGEEAALLQGCRDRLSAEAIAAIRDCAWVRDPFTGGRTFRASGQSIVPADVGAIRPLAEFYGYRTERRVLGEHFAEFAGGAKAPPLLLSGLPGLGKTHLAISHTLAHPQLLLVNADQRDLGEGLERVVSTLGRYRRRRFVLFFDDINADEVDWSFFRNQVGGYLPYPPNVAMVIASNYAFPAGVISRCATFEFRPMDREMCLEMIEDYLRRQAKIEENVAELACLAGADFTNDFVNGPLEELTPRSLVRYLEAIERNPRRLASLVEEARTGTIRHPVEEVFARANRRVTSQMDRKGAWSAVLKTPPSI